MGFTQDSLANALGVSKQSVYRYERSGRVSLDVFKRLVEILGEDILDHQFRLSMDSKEQTVKKSRVSVTSFKTMVRREFEHMGFTTSLTNAPFDLVASHDKRVFSVVSNDWRRLQDKLSVLEEICDVVGGYSVCISERRVKSDIDVLSPAELSKIRSYKELFKLLSD
jgi:predicted transcriptional regulator